MDLIAQLESIATMLGTSLPESRQRLTDIGLGEYAQGLKGHLHHIYFAMASLVVGNVKNVLELGTGLGQGTAVLSDLFPDATIYTVDLPAHDKEYDKAWRKRKVRHIDIFRKSIARKNVVFIARNSFFLPSMKLPDLFDFIWVDGGHGFPVVAWDTFFAYGHLREGGFMFMHDYAVKSLPHLRVRDVVDYMTGLIEEKILILPCCSDLKISEGAKTACIRKGSK